MKDFLINNWAVILVAIIALALVLDKIINKKWDELRTAAYEFIKFAEETIVGYKKGNDRFNFVISKLYDKLIPNWLKVFFPEEVLRRKLQEYFNDIKDILDNGKKDGSTDDETKDETEETEDITENEETQ